jgi:hypothetical protein
MRAEARAQNQTTEAFSNILWPLYAHREKIIKLNFSLPSPRPYLVPYHNFSLFAYSSSEGRVAKCKNMYINKISHTLLDVKFIGQAMVFIVLLLPSLAWIACITVNGRPFYGSAIKFMRIRRYFLNENFLN